MFPNLDKGSTGVIKFLRSSIEYKRKALIYGILCKIGGFTINTRELNEIKVNKHKDGGWCGVIDTALATYVIKSLKGSDISYNESCNWIISQKINDDAWGLSFRDISRITITSWVLIFLPELADERSLSWLKSEWEKDLNSETKLTYKGALTLMAFASTKYQATDESLIPVTLQYLMSEQNDDGGFAPWKGHPVGSEPWSTGIVLLGLTSFPELIEPEIVQNTLDWLGRNQLPNGLWPCHYIEEGSAYCYWGAVEAMKYLKKIGRL